MSLVVKFYDRLFNSQLVAVEFIESRVTLVEDLNSFDQIIFDIPYSKNITEFGRIEVFEIMNNIDTLIFSGFVFEISPFFDKIGQVKVTGRSEKGLMLRRKALQDKSYNGVSVESIILDLLDDYTPYGESWTLDINITKNISLDLSQGDNYFDIINEIASQCDDAEREIVNGQVRFYTTIGEDKSMGINFAELAFDGRYPNDNNIKDIQLIGESSRANIIIGIDKAGAKDLQSDITGGIVYGVDVVSFRTGDLVEKTQKELAKRNKSQKTYKVLVETNSVLNVKKGDLVRLSISNTIDIMNIDTSIKVTKKNTVYDKAGKNIDIFVSDVNADITTDISVINGLSKDISLQII